MGMIWIAACNGQRGTYQETIMTDEERQKLVARLKNHEVVLLWEDCKEAADEIERLDEDIKFWQEEAAKWAKMFADERRNHEFEERGWPRPDASAGLIEAAVLERYAQSIAMWCYRENVTDYERLSYITHHPVTGKYANRARATDRSGK